MPDLFWSAPNGPAEQQIEVFNSALGGVRMVAKPIAQSDVLPEGTLAGQLLYYDLIAEAWVATPTAPADGDFAHWDEAANAWVFGPAGGSLPNGSFERQTLCWDGVSSWIPTPPGGTLLACDGMTSVDPSTSALILGVGAAAITGPRAQMSDAPFGNANIRTEPDGFRLSFSDGTLIEISGTVDGVLVQCDAVAFLGAAAPVPIQSITGATTQQQVDSLVAALVAFGLVSDDR